MIDSPEFEQFNWMVDMVQNIDMGLMVVNRDFNIQMWNGFMVHHTGKHGNKVNGRSLFDVFPEIQEEWFRAKCRPVFELKCRSFVVWQQRPFLFKCRNVRPITGQAEFMYQNITLNPMLNLRGEVQNMFISVADATMEALSGQ